MMVNEVDPENTRKPSITGFIFSTDYEPDPDKPGEFKAVDRISWVKAGDLHRSRVSESIPRLMPNPAKKRPADPMWEFIEPSYKRWKAGEEIPVDGTPLAAWPGCDRALADALKERGIATVEHFANLADHIVGGLGIPDVRRRLTMAKAFLSAQKGEAHMAAELAKRDEVIAKMQRDLEQLTAPHSGAPAGAVLATAAPRAA